MSMERWWNGPDKRKLKHVGKSLPQWQFVYHKSHMK